MRLGEWWATAGRRLLDSVLPPLCLGCNEIVAEPGALCATCWPAFSFIAAPMCARCGVPFAEDIGENAQCGACLRRPPRYLRARSALVYDDRSRRLVLPFKHGDRTDMAKSCGLWMARAGHELLAHSVARRSGRPVIPDLLHRARWTGSQGKRTAKERRKNVQSAFSVNARWAGQVKGKAVLLVDDVLTTGATVEACTLALQRAGARHVDVLTLARAVRAA
jgi:predicted amidophosphoribosyltransferase